MQSVSDVQYVFSFIIISFYNNIIWVRNRGVCRRIQLAYIVNIILHLSITRAIHAFMIFKRKWWWKKVQLASCLVYLEQHTFNSVPERQLAFLLYIMYFYLQQVRNKKVITYKMMHLDGYICSKKKPNQMIYCSMAVRVSWCLKNTLDLE